MKHITTYLLPLIFLTSCSSSKKLNEFSQPDQQKESILSNAGSGLNKGLQADAGGRVAQAKTYLANNELDKAELHILEALEQDSNFVTAHFVHADILRAKKDKERRLKPYLSVLTLPHGDNYVTDVASRLGCPFKIEALRVGQGNNLRGSFSPDGKSIVWQSDKDGEWNIYMMDEAGNSRPLVISKGDDEAPRFSPDGSRIVFTSTRDEISSGNSGREKREIYLFELNTLKERQLTRNDVDDWGPFFGPDTSSYIYISELNASPEAKSIDRISTICTATLGQPESFHAVTDKTSDNTAAVGYGKGKMAWVRIADGKYDIMMGKVGKKPTIALSDPFPKSGLTVSPDGGVLAYFKKVEGNIDIYSFNLKKKTETRLTAAAGNDIYPTFSPAGDKILFSSNRFGKYGLFVIKLNMPPSKDELIGRIGTTIK